MGGNNLKKILRSIVIIIAILFLFSPLCFGTEDVSFKDQIKKEDGSLFEKIIAECIGGIAQTIFDFSTSDEMGVGFKNYDELIFNSNNENDALSPFTTELWNKTMQWYSIFSVISGSLILLAIIILAYKMMSAGMNTARKNEAKESMMRLLFGGFAIALAPLFIRILIYLNNSLVHLLVTSANGSIDGLLGNDMLSSIKTGNAITTALVISMFIYLFVKLNIKFIIRQFTIIVFTIFTPVACSLWIINKNVTAASIWAGQLVLNIFMQFIYCFLFLVYLAFLPSGGGWAISLIWAMMILPLADTLQNCLQNLTSRIAGIDNEQMASRAMGMGAMLGFGLGAVKEQFKTPTSSIKTGNSDNGSSSSGLSGFVSRAKSIINPGMNLSASTDYNGNNNPIRDVIPKQNSISTNTANTPIKSENNSPNKISDTKFSKAKNIAGGIAKTGYNATKTYLKVGANMAEGNFNVNSNNYRVNHSNNNYKKDFQNTEYTNFTNTIIPTEKGDENEFKTNG